MNNDKNITPLMEQEFAIVDSIITAHTNAAIAKVNAEALQTYWEVGGYISERLKNAQWGDHVVSELADYLKRHNSKRRGYSKRNLYNMVTFYDNYSSAEFQNVVAQLRLSEFVQSQTAQIEARPIMQMPSAQNEASSIVQSGTAQFENTPVPSILCPSADKAEVEYSLCRSMSPTMVAEYKRVLIPREVMTRSLAEYCEFLKKEYKK